MTDTLAAALRPTTFIIKMTKDKTTKNTVVYKAPKGMHIDTLYVQQAAFGHRAPDDYPAAITVTVSA